MKKNRSATQNFVANLKFLMDSQDMKQSALEQKSGVSQKTISNVLRGLQVPSIETADRLAGAFGLTGWQLVMELPNDLKATPRLAKLCQNFVSSTEQGRAHIDMVAEREARYSTTIKEE